jgi:hypothetical protein
MEFLIFVIVVVLFFRQIKSNKEIRNQKAIIYSLLSAQKEMENEIKEQKALISSLQETSKTLVGGSATEAVSPVMYEAKVSTTEAVTPEMATAKVSAAKAVTPEMATAKVSATEAVTPEMATAKVSAVKADSPVMATSFRKEEDVAKPELIEDSTNVSVLRRVEESQNDAQGVFPEMQASKHSHEKATTTSDAFKSKQLFSNEKWVGISLFNRLGALLIVIGTIAIAAFEGFHPILRTSILFALALSVVTLGEFMNRKKATTVSMGVSATGVALTYVAIAASFFGLETLGMYTALIACIVATALGIFLATRYNAQVIGCFALIGGYLPIFALDPLNNPMMVGVMVYFIVLSLFSLSLALTRKWSIMNIIGFALTVIGASYLGWQASPLIALIYACFAFLLYTALPLIAGYRTKEKFGDLDVWLIILNTFISSVVIFLIANRLDIQYLHAFLCLAFAVIYAGVAFLVKRAFNHESLPTLFTLTSIAFCVIFVPFYFATRWFSVAWLVQAVVLVSFGILQRKKVAEYSGLSILGISAVFLAGNLMQEVERAVGGVFLYIGDSNAIEHWQFCFNYSVFTFGTLVIWGCYFVKNRQWRSYEQAYKVAVFANIWVFALYMIFRHIPGRFDDSVVEHLVLTSWAILTFALAFLYCKIKLWADVTTRVLANFIHITGMFGLWVFNFVVLFLRDDGYNIRIMINLFMMTIGFVMVIYYHLTEKRNSWTVAYKNINIINIWLAFLWCFGILIRDFFGVQMILLTFTFLTAYAITRIPVIADKGTHAISIAIHIIGITWLFMFNLVPYDNVWGLMALNGVVQIIALIALNDLINLCNKMGKINTPKVVILSAYFLLVVTQIMMVQGNVAFNSAVISIMYAVAAFAWIIVGFRQKSKPIRQAGLFLSMAAVAKLLVVDTWGLSIEMRIISYTSLGLLLMLISLVYQRLSKRLES